MRIAAEKGSQKEGMWAAISDDVEEVVAKSSMKESGGGVEASSSIKEDEGVGVDSDEDHEEINR